MSSPGYVLPIIQMGITIGFCENIFGLPYTAINSFHHRGVEM